MLDLTFGEQVKIILRRKGMTIKELAELIEAQTGKKMSRQNLTQRLGRDNFQEQDMRQIAEILGCRFQLSIMEESVSADKNFKEEEQNIEIDTVNDLGADVTVGEVIDNFDVEENIVVEQVFDEEVLEEVYVEAPVEEVEAETVVSNEEPVYEEPVYEEPAYEEAAYEEPVYEEPAYEEPVGDVNPYTGREYETNSVRVHPKKIGYVQVYDREEHKWIDMTEWAFLGYQEQKKMLLGKDYDPPIYLD